MRGEGRVFCTAERAGLGGKQGFNPPTNFLLPERFLTMSPANPGTRTNFLAKSSSLD
jgi:hypothetical protein